MRDDHFDGIPPMTAPAAERELEARIEALRREVAGVTLALKSIGQRLDELMDELRSRRRADKVIALDWLRRGEGGRRPDILGDFLG